ncbi:MAG: Ig-like domain-containing protein, partial [Planctomycetota bacterium]
MLHRPTVRTFALASGLALAACGGTESGGSLEILSCSLNCGSSGNGPLTCSINQVAVNGSIAVLFSQPINPDSLNSISFRVVSETGTTPLGEYVIDPANPARVFFRPLVTFGSDGLPEFGLDPLLDYDIEIPAFTPGALGFFVESTSGARNSTELACTVAPSLGVDDVNDGAPVVEAFVEEIIPIFDNGEQIGVEVVGSESLVGIEPGVETSSRLRFEFDDVMNPATLVNTVTNTSPSISVRVDIDGDLTDSADQLVIPGTFTLDINQNLNEAATTVIYTPTTPFPTAGVDDGGLPRAIVVELPNSISDLGGNGLANAGTLTFVTTTQPAPIPEDFLLTFADGLLFDQDFEAARLDPAESGVLIDVGYSGTFDGELLDGRLLRALGGGSGRLGALQVAPGEEVFLSTGPIPTVFGPNLTTGSVVDGMGDVVEYRVQSSIVDDGLYAVEPFLAPGQPAWFEDDDPSTGPGLTTQTVTDGVFEFSSLDIQPGGRLTFVGDSPARLFVRGRAKIDGLVRTEGESSRGDLDSLGELDEVPLDGPPIPEEDTNGNGLGDGFGGAGGAPGSGGGRGGDGGDRVDAPNLVGVGPPGGGAGDVPPGGAFPWGFAGFADAIDIELDGGAGEGRNGLAPAGGDDFGAGQPGLRYPAVFPTTTTGALDDFGDLILNSFCESRQFGPGGAGGSFAVPGGEPTWDLSPGQAAFGGVVPPPLPVGSTSLLRAFEQELDPSRPGGQLVGGAGGGGGGTGAAFATTTGLPLNCGTGNPGLGGVLQFLDFIDGLGAGGGGGG